ncbi:hypothetical protein IB234_15040 [Pseudomonas sp. PDM16]|uniref:hypothetical protein n=1 Tax=Pseudomonas sp. PDM16 TaxID=2769292 RepID=UPI001781D52C|nr:hypothetical protein [Pseudomonas sp. PDM16]MBD9415876.1 hypothetical protein [Pseudomonas sp. PDM16]
MTERPILFSGPMVRAIIEGRKTVTRRVAKPVKHPDLGNIYAPGALVLEHEPQHVIDRACPYGQPGDRLWVRETFAVYGDEKFAAIHYRADRPHDVGRKGVGYKPSIHMPRWVCRILLEITAVRVERLQDISEDQAEAEGTQGCVPYCQSPYDSDGAPACDCMNLTYKESFQALWSSINGANSWAANPWVWVVEFKRVMP